MISRFSGINISTRNTVELVKFYNEKPGIPILNEGFGNYDGAQLGFIENAPVIFVWDENKWGKAGDGIVNIGFQAISSTGEMKSAGSVYRYRNL